MQGDISAFKGGKSHGVQMEKGPSEKAVSGMDTEADECWTWELQSASRWETE